MIYDKSELLDFFRKESSDTIAPFLWSDDDIYRYIAEAQEEFCSHTRSLYRAVTLPIVSNQVSVPSYMRIPEAIIIGDMSYAVVAEYLADRDYAEWRQTTTSPLPVSILSDRGTKLNVWPLDHTATQGVLTGFCVPENNESDDPLEIPEHYQYNLVYGALKTAYDRADADALDIEGKARAQREWTITLDRAYAEFATQRVSTRNIQYGGI